MRLPKRIVGRFEYFTSLFGWCYCYGGKNDEILRSNPGAYTWTAKGWRRVKR